MRLQTSVQVARGYMARQASGWAIVRMNAGPRRSLKRAGTTSRPFSSRPCSADPVKRGNSADSMMLPYQIEPASYARFPQQLVDFSSTYRHFAPPDPTIPDQHALGKSFASRMRDSTHNLTLRLLSAGTESEI